MHVLHKWFIIEVCVPIRPIDAKAPADYLNASSIITRFFPVARRHCLNITINYDYEAESVETFNVVLTGRNLPHYVSLSPEIVTVSILNRYRK